MMSIKGIKAALVGNIFTMDDVENLLGENKFFPIETEEAEGGDNLSKYTNGKCQLWIYYTKDEEENILVAAVKRVTKSAGNTRVDPFHTFEDLSKVLSWFWKNGKIHHWLVACLMVAFGRRVGDTISLRWCDLYLADGTLRDRLNTLVEQKTGKIVGVRNNPFAAQVINEYCEHGKINPVEHLAERIFDITDVAFRKATKEAAKDVGLTYPVSTHSYRKFYANMIYKLHQQDADALSIVQSMMGHSDPNITKMYIGAIDEKIERYNQDYAKYLIDCKEGKEVAFSNSPVIVMTMENMREILAEAYRCGRSAESDSLEDMNKLLAMVDEQRIS